MEKKEGTHIKKGHTWSRNTHGGDIHSKEITWNENYTEKKEKTYTE